MNFGIVLFPSTAFQDIANGYRRRYDAHYANIPPHLTVKERFSLPTEDIPVIVDALSQIARDCAPISIDVYKVDTFYPQSTTIFYKIRENKQLSEINQALYEPPFPNKRAHSVFIPHITIAQKLPQAEHADIVGQLKMIDVSHQETINNIQLLQQHENGTWSVFKSFLLEGNK